jgi:hypothetical protein
MRSLIVTIVFCAGLSTQAHAETHAVGFRVGMLGLGVEYAYRVSDRISVRGGLNGSGVSFDETESGIDYGFDLDFDSVSVGVDVYPLKGKFRVSAGVLKNDSGLSAIGTPGQDYAIGDDTYTAAEVGTLTGRVGFGSTAPYLAVGWDWLRDKKVGVALDIGLLKQGAPVVSMRADGPIASDPQFMDDLAAETLELQQSLDDLDVYPYAMFGVVVRF